VSWAKDQLKGQTRYTAPMGIVSLPMQTGPFVAYGLIELREEPHEGSAFPAALRFCCLDSLLANTGSAAWLGELGSDRSGTEIR